MRMLISPKFSEKTFLSDYFIGISFRVHWIFIEANTKLSQSTYYKVNKERGFKMEMLHWIFPFLADKMRRSCSVVLKMRIHEGSKLNRNKADIKRGT